MARAKIVTAQTVSKIGRNQSTFTALWGLIPDSIKDKLTGEQLGQLIDLLYAQKEHGANYMCRELTQ